MFAEASADVSLGGTDTHVTVCGTTYQKPDLVTVMVRSVHVTPELAHFVTGAGAVAGLWAALL